MNSRISLFVFVLLQCFVLNAWSQNGFVKTAGHQFTIDNKPYYYIGANYWYGAHLGLMKDDAKGIQRLRRELDFLKDKGVTNLRVLAAVEGSGQISGVRRVESPLQPERGVFDESKLDGLDILLTEMGKRNMKAVLFLSNNWEWSGGFLQYLNWNGLIPDSVLRRKLGWDELRALTSKFYTCEPCKTDYQKQVKLIVSRTNKITKKKYAADPTIMSWELANEPRPMRPTVNKEYKQWISSAASFIKSIDKNHLVTIGHEGDIAVENNTQLYKDIHADKNVDYLTIHIWPKNWGWFRPETMEKDFPAVKSNTLAYIEKHAKLAAEMKKPLVLEEFGFPRDHHSFDINASTQLRDEYFDSIFEQWKKSRNLKGSIAGINFWTYGGSARPIKGQVFWKEGDQYLGDPPMEEQGLNSVFNGDHSTWQIIRYYAKDKALKIDGTSDRYATKETKDLYFNLKDLSKKGIMFGHQDALAYGVNWKYVEGRSDVRDIVGDYPAVYGWELGNLELGMDYNLDSVPFDKMKQFIRDAYKRGGLNTISWHLANPVNLENAWDTTHGGVKAVLPGGSKNTMYNVWLDRLADFLLDLKGSNGELIPVLFRPYHELTGNWFWWCKNTNDPTEFKLLWRYTADYLRNVRGVHNLLYVYNTADVQSKEEFLERYPGDDMVDMVSFDAYQYNDPTKDESFVNDVKRKLQIITEVGNEKNKLTALAETGYEKIPYAEWWTNTLWKAIKDYKISYVLIWRNAGKMPNGNMHYYAPYKGHGSEKDFHKFYELQETLFEKEVKKEEIYK